MIFDSITIHALSRPVRARLEDRRRFGPYTWTPTEPGHGRGFYTAGSDRALEMDREGATLRLRISYAAPVRGVTGYYTDEDGIGETMRPVIARLPHGRGFLAGWTLGPGMCATVGPGIYGNEREATHAAHEDARIAAEREQEYQAEERAKRDEEERAERARADEVAGLGTEE